MRVRLNSIVVDDQEKALKFYTEVLGFVKKTDIPAGGGRWITVVPPDEPDGPELVLEPSGFDFATTYRRALYEKGIPFTALASDDVQAEYETLQARGVVFTGGAQQGAGLSGDGDLRRHLRQLHYDVRDREEGVTLEGSAAFISRAWRMWRAAYSVRCRSAQRPR